MCDATINLALQVEFNVHDVQGSAQDSWSAYIFSTKFKQITVCIISWSDSKPWPSGGRGRPAGMAEH
jgi:hypothetical protein